MKYLLLFFTITLGTCKSTDTSNMISSIADKEIKTTDCREDGTCEVEVLKNKNYTIETDSMGNIYPKIVDGENIVVKYTYMRGNPNNYADGSQSETIHFIISNNMKNHLENCELQNVKMLFGKNCFCKGIQGFYKVDKGSFTIESSNINIDITIPKLGEQQYVKKVNFTLK